MPMTTQSSPCLNCKFYYEEQIEQFLYQAECYEDVPEPPFMGEWGCWKYEKRKERGDE